MKKATIFLSLVILFTTSFRALTNEEYDIDKRLRITTPIIGSKIIGKARISGTAKSGSFVLVTVQTTYYKYIPDFKNKKLNRGEGPIKVENRSVKVKADGQGFWKAENINFQNLGFSTSFKIVAKSVAGGNATYVTAINETKPAIAWD